MEIADLLSPSDILIDLQVASKRQALEILAHHAAQATALPERAVFEVLLDRERLGTTGVGRGIAIPHGKVPGLERLYGLLATLKAPIAYEAVDEQPVDLIFLLLAPEAAGAEHLKALARISRLLRDRGVCERLRAARTPAAALAILLDTTASHAA
jgi:PTS system nitrogen regulatory IIA component